MPRRRTVVGPTHAAALLGISAPLLHYRAATGKIPVYSHRPLRFRLADVADPALRARMAQRDPRGSYPRRPRSLVDILEEAQT